MRYRKKPVVIEAMRVGVDDDEAVMAWSSRAVSFYPEGADGPVGVVHTLEGLMYVAPGDWIIKGIAGELYPIKDAIFRETYDEVADAS